MEDFNHDVLAERYLSQMEEKESYTRGDMETCFVVGCQEAEVLQPGMRGTFGQAVGSLKHGFRVAREGWNGKGMFLWLKPLTTVKSEWCHDPKLKDIADANGGNIVALGTICMKTADNKILTGWLASQTDILSADWFLVE
jgi:hypothetical protein